jgi:hypothetical protein
MTMPDKGTRSIVVNGKKYRYSIKGKDHIWNAESEMHDIPTKISITIENQEGKHKSFLYEYTGAVTPADIEQIIKDKSL